MNEIWLIECEAKFILWQLLYAFTIFKSSGRSNNDYYYLIKNKVSYLNMLWSSVLLSSNKCTDGEDVPSNISQLLIMWLDGNVENNKKKNHSNLRTYLYGSW